MVQDQLVDYISSQMKLGVTRDAIKSSLVGAGWQAMDVEDTLKKAEGAKTVLPAVTSSSMSSSKAGSAFPSTGMSSSKPSDASVIRVSDLISTPDSSGPINNAQKAAPLVKPSAPVKPTMDIASKPSPMSSSPSSAMGAMPRT